MLRHARTTRYTTSDGYAYLTKRLLLSSAKSAGRVAAKNAMELMGYVVTIKDGWVVKEHQNGTIEQIEKLQTEYSILKMVFTPTSARSAK